MTRTLQLKTRLAIAGSLLMATTIATGVWSVSSFRRVSRVVGETVTANERVTDATTTLASTLEREDDAVLLVLSDPQRGQQEIATKRAEVANALLAVETFNDPAEHERLRVTVDAYQASVDALARSADQPDARTRYHEIVNPLLRHAVAATTEISNRHFRSSQSIAEWAGGQSTRSMQIVATISVIALLLLALVVVHLARVVMRPISEMTRAVQAIRRGDFSHRVIARRDDELGRLGGGLNRMADELDEFRRTNVGEVIQAKETLEATLEALPDAVVVIGNDRRVSAANPRAIEALGATRDRPLSELPVPAATRDAVENVVRSAHTFENVVPSARTSDAAIDLSKRPDAAIDPSKRPAAAIDPSKRPAIDRSKRPAAAIDPSKRPAAAIDPSKRPAAAIDPLRRAAIDPSKRRDAAIDRSKRPEAIDPSMRPDAAIDPSKYTDASKRADGVADPSKRVDAALDPLKRPDAAIDPSMRLDLSRAIELPIAGHPRRLLPRIVPIAGQRGAVLVLSDVTELARLDEMRLELVAVASHELRTPLTTMRMTLSMLQERATAYDLRDRELVSTAMGGVEQLSGLVDEFLDLTRIEAGQLRLQWARLSIADLIRTAAGSFTTPCEQAKLTLDVDIASEVPSSIAGDPARLAMVVSNLLSNAVKYTPAGGRIAVRATLGDGVVLVEIGDSGPGVPPEFRERVFDRFFRVEQTRDAAFNAAGAGIGLYIARQVIEAHGGTIACDASPLGGARFVATLPVERPREAELPPARA